MDSLSLKIVLLAVLQGVTEFLPISSKGHEAVVQYLLGIRDDNLLITIVLHGGSLLAIIVFYARDLLALTRRENWRSLGLLACGTLPLVVLGLPLKRLAEHLATNLWVTAGGFAATATLLLLLYRRSEAKATLPAVTWADALWVGGIQCVAAVVPGLSRSGSTISLAGRRGLTPETAARFSFLLAVPAIVGALLLEGKSLLTGPRPAVSLGLLGLGAAVSFAVSLAALVLLISLLRRGRFAAFGYYCIAAAVVALALAAHRQFSTGSQQVGRDAPRPGYEQPIAEGQP